MKIFRRLHLRTSVILLLLGTLLASVAIIGSGLLLVMSDRIEDENREQLEGVAAQTAQRVEIFLEELQARVELLGEVYAALPADSLQGAMDDARRPSLDAIFVLNAAGRLDVASIEGRSPSQTQELVGVDLSTYPLFREAMAEMGTIWSDKHISAVTGGVTLGLASTLPSGEGVVIAELSFQTLLDLGQIAHSGGSLEYWIVDKNGEIVADTGERPTERLNLSGVPVVAAGLAGEPLPERMDLGGVSYQVSAARSDTLGWLFVSRIPSGLANPRFRELLILFAVGFVGTLIVGTVLAPWWSLRIVRPLRQVAQSADSIARGDRPDAWPRSRIVELNKLSMDLGRMADGIGSRERELRTLNAELEQRVDERTVALRDSNIELQAALDTVRRAQDELIQSEKLAAIGRLVAGLAHEMNTPLGNGHLAITTLSQKLGNFERATQDGLRRSELNAFVDGVRTTVEIVERNLRRAGELIGSLKQVAADRTSSRRRAFTLEEVIDEVLITLSPSLRNKDITFDISLPQAGDTKLDSFPGELGQVLTNLIENCLAHGFAETDAGIIKLTGECHERFVTLRLSDNGVGMPPDVARRVFDPFFTTALGRGGTGLGLFIAYNAVNNILGGTIHLDTAPGEGTRFTLSIPLVAPYQEPEEEPAAKRVLA